MSKAIKIKAKFSDRAQISKRKTRRCDACPKWDFKKHWCPILGRRAEPHHSVCQYGWQLIQSKQNRESFLRTGGGK